MGGNNQINHSKIKIDLRNCTPISSAYTFCKADSETIINLFWIDIPNRDVIGFTTAYAINIYIYIYIYISPCCECASDYGYVYSIQTLWDNNFKYLVAGGGFSPGIPVYITNKTDC